MSIEVALPNDQSATLKDKGELSNKEVKALHRYGRTAAHAALHLQGLGFDKDDPNTWAVAADMTDEEADTIDLFQRACVIARLESWTLDRPKPTTLDEVDDLPQNIYVPLTVAAADISFEDKGEVSPDPKAPIAN